MRKQKNESNYFMKSGRNGMNHGMTLIEHEECSQLSKYEKPIMFKNLMADNLQSRSDHSMKDGGDQFYERNLISFNDHFSNSNETFDKFRNIIEKADDGTKFEETDNETKHSEENDQKHNIKRQKFRRWRHKEYQCDDCDRMFTLKHNLQNHYVLYHMGVRTIYKPCPSCKCEICGKIYSAPSVLAEHMQCAHEMQGMKEECSHCSQKFLTITALNRHFKKEHGREYKKCSFPECQKLEFKFQKDLNEHFKMYHKSSSKSLYTCSICDISFKRASAKMKHEENHMVARLERLKKENEQNKNEAEKLNEIKTETNIEIKEEKIQIKDEIKENQNVPQMPKHLLKFQQELEAVPIKRKVARRICKDEILAKIK